MSKMSASKPQTPSPSSFIYTSSSSAVSDCITVAADDDRIQARSSEPQAVTGLVIFNTIHWRPNPRSLSPPGARVIELPDSDSGEQDHEHTKLLRDYKAGSVSPLSLPPQPQLQQHTPVRTVDTDYPSQLMSYDVAAMEDTDDEDHYPERFALSPNLPPQCPTSDNGSSPKSSASSTTRSFCTCRSSPTSEADQSGLILEIQYICVLATQKFIRGHVFDQRRQRRRRERALVMKRLRERGKARSETRERESTRNSHENKVRKMSPVRRVAPPRAVSPISPRVVRTAKAMVYSSTDSDTERESPSGNTSQTFTSPKIPTSTSKLTSRRPTSPFSYTWMSSQLNPNPTTTHLLTPNAAAEDDLDTTMSDPPSSPTSSSTSADTDYRTILTSHRLPFGSSNNKQKLPSQPIDNKTQLNKNISKIGSIIWHRSLSHPLEKKRETLQEMAYLLDLGAAVLTSDQPANPPTHSLAVQITDAGILLCEILKDWDAVERIEELEGVWLDALSRGSSSAIEECSCST